MKVRVASAGTGKTTSLVLRYLELVGAGTPLRRIAGVTFTRTAAAELRQRVGDAVRELLREGSYLEVGYRLREAERPAFEEALRELEGATLSTIHGFMRTCLALVAPTMGLDPDLRSLGEWEAGAMFEEELRGLLLLAERPEHGLHAAGELLGWGAVELAVRLFQQRSLSERFIPDDSEISRALVALFESAYKRFEVRLGAALLPPSEVERKALLMARTAVAVRRLAGRYRVVLVDEFQDVNPLQGQFFELLEAGGMQVEVVGDPKQSIYGFRNADVEVFRRAMAAGQMLPPLRETRRHARVLARFLNRLTGVLAENQLGFGEAEAPEVEVAGPQAQRAGRVELHWLAGDAPIAKLREQEAQVLAERLAELHRTHGYAFHDMAVLARSYKGLEQVEQALLAGGIPYVLLQGRGYFERLEIRDLYHALRVGVDARGLSLAAWLRSPFGQLELEAVNAVLRAEQPLEALAANHPEAHARLERIQQAVRGTPVAALKTLIREPFIAGRRYVDFLGARARENVDALLFTVAQQPPGDLEILLERLQLLSRQADAGDVPQSGEGVQLLTVHRAKGLEWPLVAVFDVARMLPSLGDPLLVHPEEATVSLVGSAGFDETKARVKVRQQAESYRLLYVAVSRPREVLLVTGSAKGERGSGWLPVFERMELGPGARPFDRPEFVLRTHPYRPLSSATVLPGPRASPGLEPAAWIDRRFRRHPHPPVQSPSGLKDDDGSGEPLPVSDPDEGERLPGRATTVGTLVHYAISQNWSASNPLHLDNLQAQEVMFPYRADEQEDILAEVRELLASYQRLLGPELASLASRAEDFPELPMAMAQGHTVWQGIIDRLYRVGSAWVLEDYKTDREIRPERYHFQLATYFEAVRRVRRVEPRVQLIYLREGRVIEIPRATLEAAYQAETLAPPA